MPKYIPPKGYGPLEKTLVLIIAVLILGGIIWQAPYFLLIILVIGILIYFHNKRWGKKLSILAAKRKGCDIGTFTKSFDYRKIDTWIIRSVYEELQKYLSTKKLQLPILATDHLAKDLNIDIEDLNDFIMESIAQRTGRTFENYEKNPYYNNLNTVSDLVGYFNFQPVENKDTEPSN